jgi:hypothetical protein
MSNKKLTKLIYKSFDGALSIKEAELLKRELSNSTELKGTYEQIKKIRSAVSVSSVTSFKPFFEERVLNRLNNQVKPEGYISGWAESFTVSFRQIAVSALVLLCLLIFYNLNNGNNLSIENLLGTYKTPIEYILDPTIHYFWSAI